MFFSTIKKLLFRDSVEAQLAEAESLASTRGHKASYGPYTQILREHGSSKSTLIALRKSINQINGEEPRFEIARELAAVFPEVRQLQHFAFWKAFEQKEFDYAIVQAMKIITGGAQRNQIAQKALRCAKATKKPSKVFIRCLGQINPDAVPEAISNVLMVLADRIGDTDQIIRWSGKVLETNKDNYTAAQLLFEHQRRKGNAEAAKKALLEVTLPEKIDSYQAFRLAFDLVDAGAPSKARKLIDNATAGQHLELKTLCTSVFLHLSNGSYVRALEECLKLEDCHDPGRLRQIVYGQFLDVLKQTADQKPLEREAKKKIEEAVNKTSSIEPSDISQTSLTNGMEKLKEVRSSYNARHLLRDQRYKASFICPIHRPTDVETIVSQLSAQTWKNAEAVFALNGGEVDAESIRSNWSSDVDLKIVDCHDQDRLGAIFNRAVSMSSGEIIFKIDADDLYMPDYAADSILSLDHFGADLVAKLQHFLHLKKLGLILLDPKKKAFTKAIAGQNGAGGTFCGWRRVFEQYPLSEDLLYASDVEFTKRLLSNDQEIRFTDPFNYVYQRSGQKSDHTWSAEDLMIVMQQAYFEVLGKSEIIDSMVRADIS